MSAFWFSCTPFIYFPPSSPPPACSIFHVPRQRTPGLWRNAVKSTSHNRKFALWIRAWIWIIAFIQPRITSAFLTANPRSVDWYPGPCLLFGLSHKRNIIGANTSFDEANVIIMICPFMILFYNRSLFRSNTWRARLFTVDTTLPWYTKSRLTPSPYTLMSDNIMAWFKIWDYSHDRWIPLLSFHQWLKIMHKTTCQMAILRSKLSCVYYNMVIFKEGRVLHP